MYGCQATAELDVAVDTGGGLALYWLIYGARHWNREYNRIYFVAGIPLLVLSVGPHWLIRRLTGGNTLAGWFIELISVGGVVYYIRR